MNPVPEEGRTKFLTSVGRLNSQDIKEVKVTPLQEDSRLRIRLKGKPGSVRKRLILCRPPPFSRFRGIVESIILYNIIKRCVSTVNSSR